MAKQTTETSPAPTLPSLTPIFPLPDHVLLPHVTYPYRIFEPRYRQMVENLLEQPEDERFVAIPRVNRLTQSPDGKHAGFEPVATIGRMTSCEPLDGGHYFITVVGLSRVQLTEIPSDALYRMAALEPLPDAPLTAEETAELDGRVQGIVHSVYSLTQWLGAAAKEVTACVADPKEVDPMLFGLAAAVLEAADMRQAVLEAPNQAHRADLILDALTSLLMLVGARSGQSHEA